VTIPIVILSVILFCLILSLVLVLALVPSYIGDVCVKEVNAGEQPQCEVETYDREDAYVFSPKATTYQYAKWVAYRLEGVPRYREYKYSMTVKPGDIGFHNFTAANHSWYTFHFHLQLSDPADVLLITQTEVTQFMQGKRIKYAKLDNRSVTNCEFEYKTTTDYCLMVINNGNSDITVEDNGWINRTVLKMERSRALSVCEAGEECRIEKPNGTLFIVDYTGEEDGVPASILTEYEFNRELTIPLIQLPIFTVFVIAGLVALWVVWCKSKPVDEKKTSLTSGVAMETTASSTTTPVGVQNTPDTSFAVVDNAPPPVTYNYDTNPGSKPADDNFDPTLPPIDPNAQTDAFGVPI